MLQIVDKHTGILSIPGELSGPADADHHTICKYHSRADDNYVLVVKFLKQISKELVVHRKFISGQSPAFPPVNE